MFALSCDHLWPYRTRGATERAVCSYIVAVTCQDSVTSVIDDRVSDIGEITEVLGGTSVTVTDALSTTNLTWTDLGSNRGLRNEGQATGCLSHGTVFEDSDGSEL